MKRIIITFVVLLTLPLLGNSQTLNDINKPTIQGLDEVAPFHGGLAAVRKGEQWGFIDKTGKLVIDFRDDLVWNKGADTTRQDVMGVSYPRFKDGRCLVKVLKEEDIPHYGFIDTEGKIVIAPEYLNVTEFDQGRAVGIYVKKTLRGKNNFQLNIYDYSFMEVVLNTTGEIEWPLAERDNILMSKRRYGLPELKAKLLADNLISIKSKKGNWKIHKLELQSK